MVWKQQDIVIPVSINISLMFFKQHDLAQKIKTQLSRYPDIDGSQLALEIHEFTKLGNITDVVEKSQNVRN